MAWDRLTACCLRQSLDVSGHIDARAELFLGDDSLDDRAPHFLRGGHQAMDLRFLRLLSRQISGPLSFARANDCGPIH